MKVGIVTFTEGYNYGNKLQNYALRRYLEDNFACEVKTVNNCVVQGGKLSKLRLLLVWSIPSKKHYMYWKRLIRFKKFNKEYLNFTKEKLTNTSKNFGEVDCFVCGSDQIWNPNYYSSIDLLTGNLQIPKRSISYAASFGIDEIPQNKKEAFARALRNLEAISVREVQGMTICKELGCMDCITSIDPTFLLPKSEWIKVIKKPSKKIPRKYVVTYFLGEIQKTSAEIIDDYCKRNNCSRIDLNSVNSLEWFDITPFEFLYIINNSEFVFTDSFHASVFSIIFGKKFLTADRVGHDNNKMNSRIRTLFSMFSCEDHKMKSIQETESNLIIDEERVDKIIQNKEREAYNYFSTTLFK